MYEGLREGLRNACHVEMISYEDITTNETICEVWRTFRNTHFKWWEMHVAKIVLYQGGQKAIDHVNHEHHDAAEDLIDKIFNEVDWDRFFDPWYMGVTHADKVEVFRHTGPEPFQTNPVKLLLEPKGIIWGDYKGDPANY